MTKREILSTVSSILHPLGFLALFALKAKLLIQSMRCKKIEWDEEIPEELRKYGKDGYKEYLKSKGLKLRGAASNKGGSVLIYSYTFFVMHQKQHTGQLVI